MASRSEWDAVSQRGWQICLGDATGPAKPVLLPDVTDEAALKQPGPSEIRTQPIAHMHRCDANHSIDVRSRTSLTCTATAGSEGRRRHDRTSPRSNSGSAQLDPRRATLSVNSDIVVIDGCTPRIGSDRFLDQILDAGVSAVCVTVSAQIGAHMVGGLFQAIEEINVYYNLAEVRPDKCLVATSTADIAAAKETGRLALILTLQNCAPIEADPVNLLPFLHRNGVKIAQLTYNERNRLGDGCFEPVDGGLTTIGRQAVREMNRLGILIDLSHVGLRTGLEAIEYSDKPCVFTHTGCASLTECLRNKPDDLIKNLADRGGIIALSPYSPFCQKRPGQRPKLEDYLNHVDRALELVGDDHVAIGTDIAEHWAVRWFSNSGRRMPDLVAGYSWETIYADGFDSLSCIPSVLDAFRQRGYTEETVRKLAGANWFRIFEETW